MGRKKKVKETVEETVIVPVEVVDEIIEVEDATEFITGQLEVGGPEEILYDDLGNPISLETLENLSDGKGTSCCDNAEYVDGICQGCGNDVSKEFAELGGDDE